jgi:hypothetical protein
MEPAGAQRMRTEDDLRAALATLEEHAPTPEAVMRRIAGSADSPRWRYRVFAAQLGKQVWRLAGGSAGVRPGRHTWPRRLALAGRGLALAVGATAVGLVMTGVLPGTGQAAGRQPESSTALRARLLAAFDGVSGDVLYQHSSTSVGGQTLVDESWTVPWQAAVGQFVRARHLIVGQEDVGCTYLVTRSGGMEDVPSLPRVERWKLVAGQLVRASADGEVVDVEFRTRTWSEIKNALIIAFRDDSPAVIRAQVADGDWTALGDAMADGQRAIELRWRGASFGPGTASYLWVGASSYLPIKGVFDAGGLRGHQGGTITDFYRFLPPTSANLAKLRVPIPEGFRRTPEPALQASGGR